MPAARRLVLIAALAAAGAATVGCGSATAPARAPGEPAAHPAPQPSRPGLTGRVLVVLERQDLQFGRHDTLTVGADGRANLVLAHGGGGFRNATCRLSGAELGALRHDLRALPLGRAPKPRRRVPGRHVPDGVISAKPPWFAVTYRGHREQFSGDAVPRGGAPLAGHMTRVLTAREGRCRVTFHRP